MYCNLFDSVRNSPYDSIQTEGLFFHAILSGYHPTLALNQVVDTAAIGELSSLHPEFGDLIERGAVRVSLFGRFKSLNDYLASHLEPLPGRSRNPFIFSSLPFLYSGAYTDPDIQRIYTAMLDVIQGGSTRIKSGVFAASQHREMVEEYLRNVCNLSKKLEGRYLSPSPAHAPEPSLSQMFEKTVSRAQRRHPDTVISPVTLELRELLQQFRQSNFLAPDGSQDFANWQLDSRSFLYRNISDIVGSLSKEAAEAKAIVDLCYNERVAASINDGEADLMIMDPRFSTLENYSVSRTIDSQNHIVSALDDLSSGAVQLVTWEMLKTVYDMAETRFIAHEKSPEAWCEALARCSEMVGLPGFDPGFGIAEQNICFTAELLRESLEFSEADDYFPKEQLTSVACCSMEVTRRHTDNTTPENARINTGSLKPDYAGGGK